MRLTGIEEQLREQNCMSRTIIACVSLSIDDTEDMLKEPLDTAEDLLAMGQRLEGKPYRKHGNPVLVQSIGLVESSTFQTCSHTQKHKSNVISEQKLRLA